MAEQFREGKLDPHYTGFFELFNRRKFFEAHEVLEHIWLKDRHGPNGSFYKGLIQLAGAFVHLQKQYVHPTHPKHGRRLRPAVRLFQLAAKNLAPFAPRHLQLDVDAVLRLCERKAEKIVAADYERNPWDPAHAPKLHLLNE